MSRQQKDIIDEE